MRNLAYAVTISKIDDIEGKDRIGLGHFKENAYTVIVPKTYKVGDVVCYFEVDSILPETEKFEFLRKRCYNEKAQGFVIKKMKMSGVYSYGLTMTSEELGIEIKPNNVYDDILNIRKNEDLLDGSPKQFKEITNKRPFPVDLISKSDEDNILNNPKLLDVIKNQKYFISIKLEGKSMTVFMKNRGLKDIISDTVFAFRVLNQELTNIFKKLYAKQYTAIIKNLKNIKAIKNPFTLKPELSVYGRNVEGDEEMRKFCERLIPFFDSHKDLILQGEFTSPKVQKGIYNNGTNFNIFRVKNVTGDELSPSDFIPIINSANIDGFKTVEHINLDLSNYDLNSLQLKVDSLKFKKGSSKLDENGDCLHEGIVIRNEDMSVHFKVKNREYQI